MTLKAVATPLVLTGLIALTFSFFRSACPRENGAAASLQTANEKPQRVGDASSVEPLRSRQNTGFHALAIRRNVFAYVQVAAARRNLPPQPDTQPTPAPLTPVREQEPEFPYKYIGRFGPEQNPIAVFAGNGDVINARIGDWLAGQFRLSAVGLESVEITPSTGIARRISLQP